MPIQKISDVYYQQVANPVTGLFSRRRCTDRTSGDDCPLTVEVYKNYVPKTRREMIRKSANTNISESYSTTASSYMQSRCKRLYQSRYAYGADSEGRVTGFCCDSSCNTIHYNPLNAKFGTDGAVSAREHISRRKYNSIRTSASLSDRAPRYRTTLAAPTRVERDNLSATVCETDVRNRLLRKSVKYAC
jgi:hypothetical protein